MIRKRTSKIKVQAIQFEKLAGYYKQSKKFKEEGFTIIESLIAIVVVSILLVAIAPVLALSVANRVQARRVEIASQTTRAYIDGVRTKLILAPAEIASGTNNVAAIAAPTPSGSLNCSANSYCTSTGTTSTTPTNLYCIDVDGSGLCTNTSVRDMVVQAVRYNPNSTAANPDLTGATGYSLGIRVYRADAFSETTSLKRNDLNNRVTQAAVGFGDRKAPLIQMTTEISDTIPKYSDLCARTNASNTTANLSGCSN